MNGARSIEGEPSVKKLAWATCRRACVPWRSTPAQSRHRCANRGDHWRRREWNARPGCEIPCDKVSRPWLQDKLLCRANFRGKSVERRPWREIDRDRRSRDGAHRLDNVPRIFEIHTREVGPSTERRSSVRCSLLIVEGRTERNKIQIEKIQIPSIALIMCGLQAVWKI